MTNHSKVNDIIYTTGYTENGVPLIGGIWTLYHQEGFPIELSNLICNNNGWLVDWMEAMIDASRSHNCPALMKMLESLLPDETIKHLKIGFMYIISSGKTFDQIIEEKHTNGANAIELLTNLINNPIQ